MIKLISTLLIIFGFLSCASDNECKDCDLKTTEDTLEVVDVNSALTKDTSTVPTKEIVANHEKIVKKYGEQWDFCKCVVANDSITDAFEKTLTPSQETKLMARWEYVDNKCKELTTTPNTTPEERTKHEKRVNKCLKQNGLKK